MSWGGFTLWGPGLELDSIDPDVWSVWWAVSCSSMVHRSGTTFSRGHRRTFKISFKNWEDPEWHRRGKKSSVLLPWQNTADTPCVFGDHRRSAQYSDLGNAAVCCVFPNRFQLFTKWLRDCFLTLLDEISGQRWELVCLKKVDEGSWTTDHFWPFGLRLCNVFI